MKSVRIRSYSGPHFLAFDSKYEHFLHTDLFARIVDVFKVMPWMFEGIWLHLWLVITNAIN